MNNEQRDNPHREGVVPMFQFRGVWVPPELFDLLRTGAMTATDLAVYTLIEAFTYKGSRGCFASNDYIARAAGVQAQQASRIVSKLIGLKLVRREGDAQTRKLWVIRDHPAEDVPTPETESTLSFKGHDPIPGKDRNPIPGRDSISNPKSSIKQPNTVAVRETRSGDDVLSDETPTPNTPTKARHAPAGDLKPPVNVATRPHRGQKPAQEGLFPVEGAEGQEGAVNDKFMRRAKRLRQIVVDKCGVFKPYTPSMWARDFRLLESDLSGDFARIDAALDWYAVHAGGDWVPEIESASTFREKFTKLEKAIKRDQAQNPVPAVTAKTPLHKDTADVMREISDLHWPGDAPQRLPVAISVSLTARFAFQVALPNLELSKAADEIRKRILKHHVPIPHFIGNWFQDFHKKHAWKRDWDGDLKKAVWRADHEDFRRLVDGWLRDWSGFPMNSEAWAELITAYKQVRT